MARVDELREDQFEARVLRAPGPVLVDFTAEWCPPCKLLQPVLEDLATTLGDRLSVVRLDADAAPTVTGTYGVQSLPTLLLFQNGQPVHRLVGAVSKGTLKAKIEQALAATVA